MHMGRSPGEKQESRVLGQSANQAVEEGEIPAWCQGSGRMKAEDSVCWI